MIKILSNELDIKKTFEILYKRTDAYPNMQTNKMDSGMFNEAMFSIEDELNRLYEKIRLLEMLDDFCSLYASEKIQECEDTFKERKQEIEDLTDFFTDKYGIAVKVPFVLNAEEMRDRDGTRIPSMEINRFELSVSTAILARAIINKDKIYVCTEQKYTESTVDDATNLSYLTDKIIPDGLDVTVKATIKNPDFYNYIRLVPINATLKKLVGGNYEVAKPSLSGNYIPLTYMDTATFILNSKNYNTLTVPVTPKPKPPPPPPPGYDPRLDPKNPAYDKTYYNKVKESVGYHYSHDHDRKYRHEVPYSLGYHAIDGVVTKEWQREYFSKSKSEREAYGRSQISSHSKNIVDRVHDILNSYGKSSWSSHDSSSSRSGSSSSGGHHGFGSWDGSGNYYDHAAGKSRSGSSHSHDHDSNRSSSRSSSSKSSSSRSSSRSSGRGDYHRSRDSSYGRASSRAGGGGYRK